MKKIWKMKKSKEAVSPVIATILMVAITVVLAAVLYVMVMGFGSSPESNPTASMIAERTTTPNTEQVSVAELSESIPYANLKISMVYNGNTSIGTLSGTTTPTVTWAPAFSGTPAVTVTFVDLSVDGKLGSGDYFLVKNTNTGQAMQLSILYGSDSKSIGSADWVAF